ncbi:hypothetical protein FRC02_005041, partial [Tulasnella sp. 418]
MDTHSKKPSTKSASLEDGVTLNALQKAVINHIHYRTSMTYPFLQDADLHHWLLTPNKTKTDKMMKKLCEWSGDKLVNIIIVGLLFDAFPRCRVGTITDMYDVLVSNRVYGEVACWLGMATDPTAKASANTFEIYVYLLFRESNMDRLGPWIKSIFAPLIQVVRQVCLDNRVDLEDVPWHPLFASEPVNISGLLAARSTVTETAVSSAQHTVGPHRTERRPMALQRIPPAPYRLTHSPRKPLSGKSSGSSKNGTTRDIIIIRGIVLRTESDEIMVGIPGLKAVCLKPYGKYIK